MITTINIIIFQRDREHEPGHQIWSIDNIEKYRIGDVKN